MRNIDIASDLQISPKTVSKYLNGERIHPAIRDRIDAYVASKLEHATVSKAAAS